MKRGTCHPEWEFLEAHWCQLLCAEGAKLSWYDDRYTQTGRLRAILLTPISKAEVATARHGESIQNYGRWG